MDYSIEDVHMILNDIYEKIPEDLLKGLNGGIILLDEVKYHPKSIGDSLVILGTYSRFGVRNQINIYFQSLKKAYPSLGQEELRQRLKELLMHELQHHTEFKAKIRDLEIEDEKNIQIYLNSKNN